MALSPGDPHSYARPELARIIHARLDLNVLFNRKVLKGKAILTIKREPSSNEVILDSYGLVILSVTNCSTGSDLEYHIGRCGIFGSKFTIQLTQLVNDNTNQCKIKIEYETDPNSPALYWLKPEQTANGRYPFLLSNSKYIYARAIFPCQDTPSVKFTYTATILTPMGFRVIMSAILVKNSVIQNKWVYTFSQLIPIPSYAVIIAVGVLNYIPGPDSRIGVWVENKNTRSVELLLYLSLRTEQMLRIAEKICGVKYPWDSLHICVLPPSVSHFEIECPCLIFVSPTILGGDICLVTSIARTISQNWTGILVTSANHEHFWLNKCFSMFIYKKMLHALVDEDIMQFAFVRGLNDLRDTFKKFHSTGLLKCLLPNLVGWSPNESIKYVPYEKGYILLLDLQTKIGGRVEFETFFKSYLTKFAYKSITTDDWKSYLYEYFSNKLHVLESIEWSSWLDDPKFFPPEMFERTELILEKACITLAARWINWNEDIDNSPFEREDIKCFCDLQKIYFLNYLRKSQTILSEKKMQFMADTYRFNSMNDEIRFAWLRLFIKNRWAVMVPAALKFAIKFCSPKFTYPIFRDLYEWSDVRSITIMKYLQEGSKMLNEIKDGVASILHVNEKMNV